MRMRRALLIGSLASLISAVGSVTPARAQAPTAESRIVIDVGVGLDTSINGNVNSGAIGVLQGQATAFLPQPYADVYGTGVQLRFGGGYVLDDVSEIRAMFTFQSADADLVRLGDIGPSSLYAQYSDYKSLSLDLGYRRYVPIPTHNLRVYAEATLGAAFIDNINVTLAAPQSNIVFTSTDFYDQTAAFVWTIGGGVLFKIGEQVDLNAQLGLRHVSGLADVDQFVGTGLDSVNNDSGRLTLPVIVGVRFRFK
jgi:Outer membrane protein beta-barrel domain